MVDNVLKSAVSGLSLNAQRVGAAADNIANVSTNGYKDTQITARTVSVAQTSTAYAPGGVQAIPRQLADVQGLLAPSASNTDLALSGNGFFAVSSSSEASGDVLFTRNGSFAPDNEGNLVNSAGYYLLGRDGSNELGAVNVSRVGGGDGFGEVQTINIAQDGTVTALFESGDKVNIATIPVAVFTNPAGLAGQSGGAYQETDFSGAPTYFTAGSNGVGAIQSGALELSTTDIGTEFSNMLMAENAYKASISVIKVADEMSQELLDETA